MPKVTTAKAEIEFTAGVWSDVSADVDWSAGWSYQIGRTAPRGAAQTSSLSLTLYNAKGKYTPGAQVLSDGTAAPFWPNVATRKRLRVSINGSVRWLGLIKGWYPQMDNGVLGKVVVQAADRSDALARVALRNVYIQEHLAQAAAAGGSKLLYLMNEPVTRYFGGSAFYEYGRQASPFVFIDFMATGLTSNMTGSTSSPLPAADGLTGLSLQNGSSFLQTRTTRPPMTGDFLISLWVSVPVLNNGNSMAGIVAAFEQFLYDSTAGADGLNALLQVKYSPTPGTGKLPLVVILGGTTFASITGDGPIDDGNPHHYALLGTTSAGTQTVRLYCDGVQVGSSVTGATGQLNGIGAVSLTEVQASTASGFDNLPVGIGPISYYWAGTYTPAMVQALHSAGTGFAGDTTDQRIARILAYAGLAPADSTLDAGSALMGSQPITGVDVVTAIQAASMTEAGGSAVYVKAGQVVFKNRSARKPGAPALALDAVKDVTRDVWQPSEDDSMQINQITVERADDAGSVSTQTIDMSAGGPVLNDSITTYATTDDDALDNAQNVLAQNLTPGFRLPQVSVDLVTAENDLYTAAFAVEIGARLRVSSIPQAMAPATRVDSLVEGWREEYSLSNGVESYRFTFDTSPADSPPWMVWDDASYGRWGCDSQTLTAAITNSATSLSVTNSGATAFTTDPTMYPLTIQIGAEHIQLNSIPVGSPQVFSGVTRGVDGTSPAAQAIGSSIDIAPASTWTL